MADSTWSAIKTRKEEIVFEAAETNPVYSRRWAEYDPKSVENLWGIVEKMSTVVFFDLQQKSCTYAVNVFSQHI